MSPALRSMIKVMSSMFGDKFWNNVILVVNVFRFSLCPNEVLVNVKASIRGGLLANCEIQHLPTLTLDPKFVALKPHRTNWFLGLHCFCLRSTSVLSGSRTHGLNFTSSDSLSFDFKATHWSYSEDSVTRRHATHPPMTEGEFILASLDICSSMLNVATLLRPCLL